MTQSLRKWVGLLGCCWLSVVGCEQDPRVPYIPPTLANWPQPYHGMPGLKVHVFVTGHLRVPEAMVLHGGSLTERRDLPVPVVLIEHPKEGLILFNTGVAEKSGNEPTFPGMLSSLVGAKFLRGRDIATQLRDAGFKPDAVRWVVLSNMRFDHTGAVKRFPNARVVVAKAEADFARQASSGYAAVDVDAVTNWKFIDFDSAQPLATFPAHVDVFGDGSCLLLDAGGSTPGTMAMVVRLARQPLLLADDMAAVAESVRYAAKPAAPHDLALWWDHIWRLKRFKDLVPELIVLPGHDLSTVQSAGSKEFIIHPFSPPEDSGEPTPTPGNLERLLPRPM